jgi:hypothetical protein
METTFIINTLLGFFIALFYDVLNRSKASESSPGKFDILFFLNDNKSRLILSLALSLALMLAIYFNVEDAALLLGKEWTELNNIIYIVVGATPDLVVSFAKRKAGFLQPENTKGFKRKE